MTFDARSKERLEALGRTLPKKLPPPASPKPAPSGMANPGGTKGRTAEAGRHRLEREEDPAALFRALMQASPDGNVPPHLLDRLRELEGSRGQPPVGQPSTPTTAARGSQTASTKGAMRPGRRGASPSPGDPDLYTAFAQLLLEEEDVE